jgi:hypothetical protein
MIKKIKNYKNAEETLCTLKKDGVFIVEDYLEGSFLENLKNEVLKLCEEKSGHYGFGRNYRGGSLGQHKGVSPNIFKCFNKDWMRKLNQLYKNQLFCGDIFGSHDYVPVSDEALESAPNGWLHFDKKNCLKFFVYLTDIDESSGAFFCSPGSRSVGGDLRRKMVAENNYEEKRRLEVEFPELIERHPPEPVIGEAGTLIVFDTDTLHMGGKVKKGKDRLVVRGHCF